MLNVFLGYVTSSSKGSCLTALERCTCRCPGCEAHSLGRFFFPWKVYNLHRRGFRSRKALVEWALGSLKVWPEAALVGQSFRDFGLDDW